MATDGMMDALLEVAEVAGPQAALASVGVSGGSFGLSNTERLHLEEGTVAGSWSWSWSRTSWCCGLSLVR